MNKKYREINRQGWNLRTGFHVKSDFYDVDSFVKEGKLSLKPPEIEMLGNVNGKKILHLQCHFGLDTLSWAKLGATVTGVDLSDVSLEFAKQLSVSVNLPATFLRDDVHDLTGIGRKKFDIVISTYGVLPWLQDLDGWAKSIAKHLKPGGIFLLVEFHPVLDLFFDGQVSGLNSYFNTGKPSIKTVTGTYTDKKAQLVFKRVTWQHSLSEVFTSLLQSGLELKSFKEYPYSSYKLFSDLTVFKNGVWYPKKQSSRLPYMYSVLFRKSKKSK